MAQDLRNSEAEKRVEDLEKARQRLSDELDVIALHCARLPVLDPRAPDEILGYDDHGHPR